MTKSEVEILTPLIRKLQELNSEAAKLEAGRELGEKLAVIHGFTMAIDHIEKAFQEKIYINY